MIPSSLSCSREGVSLWHLLCGNSLEFEHTDTGHTHTSKHCESSGGTHMHFGFQFSTLLPNRLLCSAPSFPSYMVLLFSSVALPPSVPEPWPVPRSNSSAGQQCSGFSFGVSLNVFLRTEEMQQ